MIPQTKIEQKFTAEEVQAAKNMREMIINEPQLKPMQAYYIAGEIVMWDQMAGVRFAESEMGKAQTFEIDFCGHVKAKIEFKDGELNVIAAMNGYGDALDPDQITITKSITQPTCPECGSTRVLDWPDKFQCRRCEHTWER